MASNCDPVEDARVESLERDIEEKFKAFRMHFREKFFDMKDFALEDGLLSIWKDVVLQDKGKVGQKTSAALGLCAFLRLLPTKVPSIVAKKIVSFPSKVLSKNKSDNLSRFISCSEVHMEKIVALTGYELCRIFDYQISMTPFRLVPSLAEQAVNNFRNYVLVAKKNSEAGMVFDQNTLIRGVLLGKKENHNEFKANGKPWKIEELFSCPGLRKVTDEGTVEYYRTPIRIQSTHSTSYSPCSKENHYGFRGPVLEWDDTKCFKVSDIDNCYSEKIANNKFVNKVFREHRYNHEICSLKMMKDYLEYVDSFSTDGQPMTLNQWVYNAIKKPIDEASEEQTGTQTKACFRPIEEYEPFELPVGTDFTGTDLQFFQAGRFRLLGNAKFHKAVMIGSCFQGVSCNGEKDFMGKVRLYSADIRHSKMTDISYNKDSLHVDKRLSEGCCWDEATATSTLETILKAIEDMQQCQNVLSYLEGIEDKIDGLHEGQKTMHEGQKVMHDGQKVTHERQKAIQEDLFEIKQRLVDTQKGTTADNTRSATSDATTGTDSSLAAGDGDKIDTFSRQLQHSESASPGHETVVENNWPREYDFTVLYAPEDQIEALEFQKFLQEFGLEGCLYDDSSIVPSSLGTDMECHEYACQCSTYYLLYMTPKMCEMLKLFFEKADDVAKAAIYAALYKCLKKFNKNKHHFVPYYTRTKRYLEDIVGELPFSIAPLISLEKRSAFFQKHLCKVFGLVSSDNNQTFTPDPKHEAQWEKEERRKRHAAEMASQELTEGIKGLTVDSD